MREAAKNRPPYTEDQLENFRAAAKKRWANKEYREKQSKIHRESEACIAHRRNLTEKGSSKWERETAEAIIAVFPFLKRQHALWDNDKCRMYDLGSSSHKILVELDGCFWHQCPDHYPEASHKSRKVEENMITDKRKNRLAGERGYTLLRLWEHEDVDSMIDRISRATQNPAHGSSTT
jgi:very-short-patch-repair endonuclease